jgi:hypothetical protein
VSTLSSTLFNPVTPRIRQSKCRQDGTKRSRRILWLRHYCTEFVSVIKPPCFYGGDFTRERIIQTRGIKHVKLKVRNVHKKKVDSEWVAVRARVCVCLYVCVRERERVTSSYHRASWGIKFILNYLKFWLGNIPSSRMICEILLDKDGV